MWNDLEDLALLLWVAFPALALAAFIFFEVGLAAFGGYVFVLAVLAGGWRASQFW